MCLEHHICTTLSDIYVSTTTFNYYFDLKLCIQVHVIMILLILKHLELHMMILLFVISWKTDAFRNKRNFESN